MAEMFGITVIDDSQATSSSDQIGIGITAIVRIKHAALYEAAKSMGGASVLARHLGVTPSTIGEWINLKSCPPKDASSSKMTSWSEERIAVMEAKLMQLTGKSWDELWPDELRDNHAFLKAPKSIEKVYNWKQAALISYAEATRHRLLEYSGNDISDESEFQIQKEAVEKVLHLMSFRERVVLRERFGFLGTPKTLEEVGQLLKITRERVRGIEVAAIKKLRYLCGLALTEGSVIADKGKSITWDDHVCDMGMPANLTSALVNARIITLRDLHSKTESQFKKELKHCSTYWITVIKRKIRSYGLEPFTSDK